MGCMGGERQGSQQEGESNEGGGRGVRVTVFRNHSPWQAGYVADVTDLRMEEAGFPPGFFVQ